MKPGTWLRANRKRCPIMALCAAANCPVLIIGAEGTTPRLARRNETT